MDKQQLKLNWQEFIEDGQAVYEYASYLPDDDNVFPILFRVESKNYSISRNSDQGERSIQKGRQPTHQAAKNKCHEWLNARYGEQEVDEAVSYEPSPKVAVKAKVRGFRAKFRRYGLIFIAASPVLYGLIILSFKLFYFLQVYWMQTLVFFGLIFALLKTLHDSSRKFRKLTRKVLN